MPHAKLVKDYVESLEDSQITIRKDSPEKGKVEVAFFVPLIASAERRSQPGFGVVGVIKVINDMSLSFHIEGPEGGLLVKKDEEDGITEEEANVVNGFLSAHLLQLKMLIDQRENVTH